MKKGQFQVINLDKQVYLKPDEYLNGWARHCGWKATLTFDSLCRHADRNRESFPSIDLMAEEHGVSYNTIRRGIADLEKWGIIFRERKRNDKGKFLHNTYYILAKEHWKKPQPLQPKTSPIKRVCLLCGSEIIDKCHFVPKIDGGNMAKDNIIILCPTHHREFDRGKLDKNSLDKINNYIEMQKNVHSPHRAMEKPIAPTGKTHSPHRAIKDTHIKDTHTLSIEKLTNDDFQEIADKYKVPIPFVISKYDDMVLWAGERPNNPKLKGRNWKLTLMKWVKTDAIKIKEGRWQNDRKRAIDAEEILGGMDSGSGQREVPNERNAIKSIEGSN